MAHKHLHDLLQEDQEPFFLKTYISDKRIQLKKNTPVHKSQFHNLKNRKIPISQQQKPNFPCKIFSTNTCFYSFRNSPEITKSPLYEFRSPVISPCRNSNSILFHVPAKTAALLYDAASRISTKKKKQSKIPINLGLFDTILKRLRNKNRNPKREIGNGGMVKVKDLIAFDLGFSDCDCNGKIENSDAVWFVRNGEGKIVDSKESLRKSFDSDGALCLSENRGIDEFAPSPSFHFAHDAKFYSGYRTPEISSPVTSPERISEEDGENHEETETKLQVEGDNAEEEQEQFSPVSVLDPSFEDDDDEILGDDDDKNGGFDLECSYEFVQRAKQHLLQKLRRFEQLAELDPIELDKRLLEDDQEQSDQNKEEDDEELPPLNKSNNENQCIIREVLNINNIRCISTDMKKLVSDLVSEEKTEHNNREEVVKRVCKRLESFKEAESSTIDMMVAFDFRNENYGWKRNNQELTRSIANDIEFAIFGLLIDELLDELV